MLLTVNELTTSITTEDETLQILDRVSLSMDHGQTVALVGESGSGKSVTALSILRLLESVAKVENQGSIVFEDQELLTLPEREMRGIRGNRISMIFQEPMTSMNPVYPIASQLIEPLIIHQGLSKSEARKNAVELLDRCGIKDPSNKIDNFPHQLSGGQRQRVMIAMALACRPALLIADEPTTALDVTIQAQILELIKDLQQEFGMAVLLISHDLTMVRKIASQVHIMHQGRVVEAGPTETIFTDPQDPYTIHLLNSVPKGEPLPKVSQAPLLQVSDLRCTFQTGAGFFKRATGVVKAVDQVSLTIRQGATFGLVGESGSGKSTLGMAILRLTASQGGIKFQGKDICALKGKELRSLRGKMQIVFQDPFSSLSPRQTVLQIIGEGLQVHSPEKSKEERQILVEKVMHEVGLDPEMAHRYPHEFSGGQRQRISIARAVILEPEFLVLDEPTSALDMTIQAQIITLLRHLQESRNMTYLFISHDLRVVRALADQIAVMHNGKVVETGEAQDVFSAPQHPYTKELFKAAFG